MESPNVGRKLASVTGIVISAHEANRYLQSGQNFDWNTVQDVF